MPAGLRVEAMYCSKRCRQASSRFTLAIRRGTTAVPAGAGARDGRPLRLAYADPPYPGHADLYPERKEVDHEQLIARLLDEYSDGWALSTSARALPAVLALCPLQVRVCSWHRRVRYTPSRRPLSAWEPLIVHGGRELPTAVSQTVTDALAYGGRFRAFPGAITGMKPPQFSTWMFAQLGARPDLGDELADLYPGSGAVTEAWRQFSAQLAGGGVGHARARPDVVEVGDDDADRAFHRSGVGDGSAGAPPGR